MGFRNVAIIQLRPLISRVNPYINNKQHLHASASKLIRTAIIDFSEKRRNVNRRMHYDRSFDVYVRA